MRIAPYGLLAMMLPTGTSGAEALSSYRQLCAPCHGERGDGRGPAAPYLAPPPRDFSRGEYKFRSTPSGSLPLDADLVRTIRRGLPGTSMPAWGGALDDGEIRGLVVVLKSWSPRFAAERPDAPIAVPDPPPLAALAGEGRRVWDTMRCAQCHGPRGRGDGPAAPTLRDAAGRPISPADFTVGLYKGGGSPRDVYRTFMTGLDGTPMPSYADAVGDERSRWALVAYVLSLGRDSTPLDWLLSDPVAMRP